MNGSQTLTIIAIGIIATIGAVLAYSLYVTSLSKHLLPSSSSQNASTNTNTLIITEKGAHLVNSSYPVAVIRAGYMYANDTRTVQCKDDPGVICFVPVKIKLPAPDPPPDIGLIPPS